MRKPLRLLAALTVAAGLLLLATAALGLLLPGVPRVVLLLLGFFVLPFAGFVILLFASFIASSVVEVRRHVAIRRLDRAIRERDLEAALRAFLRAWSLDALMPHITHAESLWHVHSEFDRRLELVDGLVTLDPELTAAAETSRFPELLQSEYRVVFGGTSWTWAAIDLEALGRVHAELNLASGDFLGRCVDLYRARFGEPHWLPARG